MSEYSAYLITNAGTIAVVQSVYSDKDEEALNIARQLLIATKFRAFKSGTISTKLVRLT